MYFGGNNRLLPLPTGATMSINYAIATSRVQDSPEPRSVVQPDSQAQDVASESNSQNGYRAATGVEIERTLWDLQQSLLLIPYLSVEAQLLNEDPTRMVELHFRGPRAHFPVDLVLIDVRNVVNQALQHTTWHGIREIVGETEFDIRLAFISEQGFYVTALLRVDDLGAVHP